MFWVYICLPEQLIGQPPPRPFDMPVFLMSHFIETSSRLRIGKSTSANICREVIHSTRANTRDITRLSEYIYFLIRVHWWFYNDTDLFRYFSRIICYMIGCGHYGVCAPGAGIYNIYAYNNIPISISQYQTKHLNLIRLHYITDNERSNLPEGF